jgi:DNA-binding NarL/FixJ family response regulator
MGRPLRQVGSDGARTKASGRAPETTGDAGSVRLLIACNGSVTWAGIKIALERDGIDVCGEVRDPRDLASAVLRLNPAVCLVDVELVDSLRHVAALALRAPSTAVLVMTSGNGEKSQDEFLAAMDAGAVGYLPMTISPERLPKAVRAVLQGELAIPRALMPMLVDHLRGRNARRHLMLSPQRTIDLTGREWEVLELMRNGASTSEIAERLLISEVTVRRHVGGILKKMQVQSRGEALKLLQSA